MFFFRNFFFLKIWDVKLPIFNHCSFRFPAFFYKILITYFFPVSPSFVSPSPLSFSLYLFLVSSALRTFNESLVIPR